MKNTSIQRGSSFRLFALSDQKFEGFRQIFEQIPRIINFKLCRLTRKKPEPELFLFSSWGGAGRLFPQPQRLSSGGKDALEAERIWDRAQKLKSPGPKNRLVQNEPKAQSWAWLFLKSSAEFF